MTIDLKKLQQQGVNYLLMWRERYGKIIYPEKVVLNIFYRKYTMEFMWNEINSNFNKNKWEDSSIGYAELQKIYSYTSTAKTHNLLMSLIQDKNRQIGNTTYASFEKLIKASQQGDNFKIEELEYSYLYYLLTDESILYWSALGGTGISKNQALNELSGIRIDAEIKSYSEIDKIVGSLFSAKFLSQNYTALKPF